MAKKTEAKTIGALKPNPRNPRKIPEHKLDFLKKTLTEFGDLSGIIYNRRSKQLVGGHQRKKVIPSNAEIIIEYVYEKQTKKGTVAEGYILFEGEKLKYREVDWDDLTEKAANLAANKGAGTWDLPELQVWLKELETADFDLDLTLFDPVERAEFLKIESFDPTEEWLGMPEFTQDDKTAYKTVQLHFHDQAAVDKFSALIAQPITDKTRTIWYPEMIIERAADKTYAAD